MDAFLIRSSAFTIARRILILNPLNKGIFLLTLLGGLSTPATAVDEDFQQIRRLTTAGSILPLESILAEVYLQHQGRLLEVELEREKTGYIYEIEMLDKDGVIRELKFDAATGKHLTNQQED